MKRRIHGILLLIIAVMLCISCLAACNAVEEDKVTHESPTEDDRDEGPTEKPTETPTEEPTEAPSEIITEAPTDPVSECELNGHKWSGDATCTEPMVCMYGLRRYRGISARACAE